MNDLIVPDLPEDDDWQEIVNRLVDTLGSDKDIPDKVVLAAEMMVAGLPTYKIAKKLGLSTNTVKGWLTRYPLM